MNDLSDLTDANAVEQALNECRRLGREAFLDKHGFGRARKHFLVHNGEVFDSKAIAGVAVGYQHGEALSSEEFSGGENGAARRLESLGFRIDRLDDWISLLTPEAINIEIELFFEVGRDAYLKQYGGGEAFKFTIKSGSSNVDAKAIVVCALRRTTGLQGISHRDIPGVKEVIAEPLQRMGFEISMSETSSSISEHIEQILALNLLYEKSMQAESMVKRAKLIKDLETLLTDKLDVAQKEYFGHSVRLANGVGVGYASLVPWISLRDPAHSPNAKKGFYVVLLFSAAGDTLYISLNQGTERERAQDIKDRVTWARSIVGGTPFPDDLVSCPQVKRVPETISLNAKGRGESYEKAHIDGIEFSVDELPPDEILIKSITFLLEELSKLYGAGDPVPSIDDRITNLADELGIEFDLLEEIFLGIDETKRQMILTGPPGTGKTYVAKKLAELFVDDLNDIRVIQFHPSYGYEDFIEGLRPQPSEHGGFSFERVPGALVRLVEESLGSPEKAGDGRVKVLIIDEINRANIPRVFGEMMHLLEYREESIRLMLSDRGFSLGKDLIIIGTMNTADRSIRTLDVAMRRRFRFFELPPSEGTLRHFYDQQNRINELGNTLFAGFTLLNQRLEVDLDRHHAIGHSFFMRDSMTMQELRRIWKQEIVPLLEDYFFDRPEKVEEYTLDGFWPSA